MADDGNTTLALDLSALDMSSYAAVSESREDYVRRMDRSFEAVVQTFLEGVIEDAERALSAPTLLASASPRRDPRGRFTADPFSFTQVMSRWYTAVRQLAEMAGQDPLDQAIQDELLGSNLPRDAYDATRNLLVQAHDEGWSTYKLKRELSRELIPKDDRGKWDSRSKYRTAVTRMARTLATQNYGAEQIKRFAQRGYFVKTWHSRHDDRVRNTHHLLDGVTVPLASEFKTPTASLRYPGDKLAPPSERINCRCILTGH